MHGWCLLYIQAQGSTSIFPTLTNLLSLDVQLDLQLVCRLEVHRAGVDVGVKGEPGHGRLHALPLGPLTRRQDRGWLGQVLAELEVEEGAGDGVRPVVDLEDQGLFLDTWTHTFDNVTRRRRY